MDVGEYFIDIINFCYDYLCDFNITCFDITFNLWEAFLGLLLLYFIVYSIFKIAE